MEKAIRGFGILSKFTNNKKAPKKLQEWPTIPQRATNGSAGYDLKADETVTIPSATRDLMTYSMQQDKPTLENLIGSKKDDIKGLLKPTMVHTGIKAYMKKDEVLYIFNRSSNPSKRGLYLANGVGVIDSDYYNNPSNEGEILVPLIELGKTDYTIHKGDRIAQGIFEPYLTTDNDTPVSKEREGGIGSTGK